MNKLKSKDLRKSSPTQKDVKKIKRTPLFFVLDQIIDTYNIGSMFRLADAASVKKIFLCGDMEYPPSSRIHKAAVGTENWVPWEKKDTTVETVLELKKQGIEIITVEQANKSISYKKLKPHFPCAVVVGNETIGVNPLVTKLSDVVVELPMLGINNSFNVWGAAAVVTYKILEFFPQEK